MRLARHDASDGPLRPPQLIQGSGRLVHLQDSCPEAFRYAAMLLLTSAHRDWAYFSFRWESGLIEQSDTSASHFKWTSNRWSGN